MTRICAKQYIEKTADALFTDEAGTTQIAFNANSRPRVIYTVNVTLSALGPAAIQLNALKAAGLLTADLFAWSVFVNDLRVIADICETPSEFLFYLQRRLRFNTFEHYVAQTSLTYSLISSTKVCFLTRRV